MHRFMVVASLVGLVASSAACARQETSDSASPVAPSSAPPKPEAAGVASPWSDDGWGHDHPQDDRR